MQEATTVDSTRVISELVGDCLWQLLLGFGYICYLIIMAINIVGLILLFVAEKSFESHDLAFLRIVGSDEYDLSKLGFIFAVVVLSIVVCTIVLIILNIYRVRECHKEYQCLFRLVALFFFAGSCGIGITLFAYQVMLMKTQTDEKCSAYEDRALIYLQTASSEDEDYQILMKELKNPSSEMLDFVLGQYVKDNCKKSSRYTYRAVAIGLMSLFYLAIFISAPCVLCIPCQISPSSDD